MDKASLLLIVKLDNNFIYIRLKLALATNFSQNTKIMRMFIKLVQSENSVK